MFALIQERKVEILDRIKRFVVRPDPVLLDEIEFDRLWKIGDKEQSVDEWMKEHPGEMEGITSLSSFINFDGFNSYDDSFVVPFSASLSKFLIERYGIALYKQMYSEIKGTNQPADNVSIIETAYGRTEHELLQEWIGRVMNRFLKQFSN